MTMSSDQIDIREFIRKLPQPQIGPAQLCILGGRIDANDEPLRALMHCFADASLAFALWETSENIELTRLDGLPAPRSSAWLLERARLFGADPDNPNEGAANPPTQGGDLELRRDGETLRWRFVGAANGAIEQALQSAGIQAEDFWAQHSPDTRLRALRRKMLLWGEYKPDVGNFVDPRVGWARLNYPVAAAGSRVQIDYLELSDDEAPAFVWWLGVSRHA